MSEVRGMVAGQPRTTTPEKKKVIELGKDLVRWASEETEELRTSWAFWYAIEHSMIESHWKALKKLPEFRPYYEIARAYLSQKIHSQQLEKGMCHRYIRLYDRELAGLEDKDCHSKLDRELRLKKEIDKEETTNVDGRLLELLEALKSNDKPAEK